MHRDLQELGGAELHRLHGGLDIAIGRHNDDRRRYGLFLHLRQQFQARKLGLAHRRNQAARLGVSEPSQKFQRRTVHARLKIERREKLRLILDTPAARIDNVDNPF